MGRRLAIAALGLVMSFALGCGELTTRTWINIIEEESSGHILLALVPGTDPVEHKIRRLQGGFLAEVKIRTADLPGPMNGSIELTDVRIAGISPGLIGNICTWSDPDGFSGGPLVIDVLGGTAESSMFMDAFAMTKVSEFFGLGPVVFEEEIDFDLASAFDMVAFFEAFLTGSADGLFATETSIASTMHILGLEAVFAMNTVVTNTGQPPVIDNDLLAYCDDFFYTQGVGESHVEILNVKTSYLRHAGNDRPGDPTVIPLAEFGAGPGSVLRISTVGTYSEGITLSDGSDTRLGGVFSSTDVVRPSGELFRIPGAIEAGADINTWPSIVCFLGVCEDKGGDDILQDFRIDPTLTITVPAGAHYLVVAPVAPWRIYGDNTGLGFGVQIDVLE